MSDQTSNSKTNLLTKDEEMTDIEAIGGWWLAVGGLEVGGWRLGDSGSGLRHYVSRLPMAWTVGKYRFNRRPTNNRRWFSRLIMTETSSGSTEASQHNQHNSPLFSFFSFSSFSLPILPPSFYLLYSIVLFFASFSITDFASPYHL